MEQAKFTHVLVAGEFEDAKHIIASMGGGNVVVSYMPLLPARQAAAERARAALIKEELSKKASGKVTRLVKRSSSLFGLIPVRSKVEEVYESKPCVSSSEIIQAADLLNKQVDSDSAVQCRLQEEVAAFEVKAPRINVVSTFSQLRLLMKEFGALRASFVLFSYQELFTAGGAEFLKELKKLRPEGVIAFYGPNLELSEKLSRFELYEDADITVLHPILQPRYSGSKEIICIPLDMETSLFEKCRNELQSSGVKLFSSTKYSGYSKDAENILSFSDNLTDALALLPTVYCYKAYKLLEDISSEVSEAETRHIICKDAANELSSTKSWSTETCALVEKFLKPTLETQTLDLDTFRNIQHDQYSFKSCKENQKSSCAHLLKQTSYVDSFPAMILETKQVKLYKQCLRNSEKEIVCV